MVTVTTSDVPQGEEVAAPHRWLAPVPAQAERCECSMCGRHDEAMIRHERALTEPVEFLLAAGWFPQEIVDLVATGSPTSSQGPMLVRVALVAIAAGWVGDPSKRVILSQVEDLSRRTGFHVDSTQPGWFEKWFWSGQRGLRKSQLWTRHVISVLQPIIDFCELGVTAESQTKFFIGRPRVDEIRRTMCRRMPEPDDPRWTYTYND